MIFYLKILIFHFVISEIQKKKFELTSVLPIKKVFNNSSLIKQIKENDQIKSASVFFLVTFLGMTIFPFVAKPVFRAFDIIQEEEFLDFINERKKN